MSFAALHLRRHSLLRGTVLVLGGLLLAFPLSHFPDTHPSLELIIPALLACLGSVDTFRCLEQRWSFYHGAVLVLLYSDILALVMIFFLLLYPYTHWLLGS